MSRRGSFRNSETRTQFVARLRNIQGKLCALCCTPLEERHRNSLGKAAWTLEHVYPRQYRYGNRGNVIVSHSACNNAKGDRDPTGCELIWLEFVNAVLGHELVREKSWSDPGPGSVIAAAFAKAQQARA